MMDSTVKTLWMPSPVAMDMREFCDQQGYRIADVIDRMMADWIDDFFPMDVEAYRNTVLSRGKTGKKRDTTKIVVRLQPDLVDFFNDTRKHRGNDDLPIGDAIAGIWYEWQARCSEAFEPTPVITMKGRKHYGRKTSANPNDKDGKHRRGPKNYSLKERIIRAVRVNSKPIKLNNIDPLVVVGWFEAFAADNGKLTVAHLNHFCHVQATYYGKVKLPGEFLVWCINEKHDPANVELFTEWRKIYGQESPTADPLYWVLQDRNIPMDQRQEFTDYCHDHGITDIGPEHYIEWFSQYKLNM